MSLAIQDAEAPSVIRVAVVDNHDVVRIGLAVLLAMEPDIDIVAGSGDAESARQMIVRHRPDVLILDDHLPGLDSVRLCGEIAEQRLPTRVAVFSAFADDATASALLMSGARAFIVKDADAVLLKHTIRAVSQGQIVVDPKVTTPFAPRAGNGSVPAKLSPSESRILRLLAQGKSNMEIALEASLSLETVKSYARSIYTKLGVSGRREAAVVALHRGLA